MAIKYILAAQIIQKKINENLMKGIELLPTEQQFAEELHFSRQTIRQALSLLQKEGLIEKRQGSGTYLSKELLASSFLRTIAVLYSPSESGNFYMISKSLENFFHAHGYKCTFYDTEGKQAKERKILNDLAATPPAGILCSPVKSNLPCVNEDLYALLSQKNSQIVFCDMPAFSLQNFLTVCADHRQGGQLLADHLILSGYHRIGCILRNDILSSTEQYSGIVNALVHHGLEYYDEDFFWYDAQSSTSLFSGIAPAMNYYIDNILPKCSALICQSPHIASFMAHEASKRGLRIPQQLQIVTFASAQETYLKIQHIPHAAPVESPWAKGAELLLALLQKNPATATTKIKWQLFK